MKNNLFAFLFVRKIGNFIAQSFPTPMEEPKKVLKAEYLGSIEVAQPTGIDVINTAIEMQLRESNRAQWENVTVVVAPSMISINCPGVSIR